MTENWTLEDTEIDLDTQKEEIVSLDSSKVSYIQGLGLVLGLQIGSGIFSSPNQIHKNAGSYGMSLIVWILSGLLAWSGASCYAELGSAIPSSGGTQAYLARIYNDYVSFLYSWSAITVLKPGSMGIIAIVLAEYVSSDPVIKRVVAGVAVVMTSTICMLGKGTSAGFLFLILKAVLLLFVMCLGIYLSVKRTHPSSESIWGGTHSIGDIITALYGGIWAYDGWDNLNFLTGDMRNPERDLPLVISTSMAIVIAVYCILNALYFGALSSESLDSSTSVALTMAMETSQKAIGVIVSGGIVISCAGALNASMVSAVRLVQVVGSTDIIPNCFQNNRWAILLQTIITLGYCCIGEFSELVAFYGTTGYIFYLATVIGMVLFRFKEPNVVRPYKSWTIAPILFITLSATIILRAAIFSPLLVVLVLVFLLAGTPWYYFMSKTSSR